MVNGRESLVLRLGAKTAESLLGHLLTFLGLLSRSSGYIRAVVGSQLCLQLCALFSAMMQNRVSAYRSGYTTVH